MKNHYTSGHIKTHRSILNWEWYSDVITCRLFFHLLLTVNWYDEKFRGIIIKRGQRVASFRTLSDETNLTVMQIRNAVKHLELTHEITHEASSKFSVFTVVNYDDYQSDNTRDNEQTTHEVTNEQRTSNERVTTNKEVKEIKEDIKEDIKDSGEKKQSRFTPPTQEEVKSYCLERNNKVDVSKFIDFYESKGWYVGKNKMKDWKACIRTWENSDTAKPKNKNSFNNIPQSKYGDMTELERDILSN